MWIAASYKTNRYQKWVEKGKRKLVDENSDDEEGGDQRTGSGKKGKNFKSECYRLSLEFQLWIENGIR